MEWTEWKQGVPSKHEGEVIGNGGLFKHIIIGSDANVGDIRVAHRLRADYYTVEDFANNESHVIHGSRLIRIKMKVAFD